jgi:hypothetical protein
MPRRSDRATGAGKLISRRRRFATISPQLGRRLFSFGQWRPTKRKANVMAERQKVLSKDYSDDFRTVTIKFLGTSDVLTVNVAGLPEAIRNQAICHGLVQKLGDAAAGEAGTDAYDAVMSV